MLTVVLTIFGLIAGFISDGQTWLIGGLVGLALGQALSAQSAHAEVKRLQAQLNEELNNQGQTLRRVESGLLWMWGEWQQAKAAGGTAAQGAIDRGTAAQAPTSQPQASTQVASAQAAALAAVTWPAAGQAPAVQGPAAQPTAAGAPMFRAAVVDPTTASAGISETVGTASKTQAAEPVADTGPVPAATGAAYSGVVNPGQAPPQPTANRVDLGAQLREFFLGGNTIARAGILVLLVGVVLLLKWAADNSLYPIEARMASAALVGAALVCVGYRVRLKRAVFGALLQGGGTAALYLTVFFSFHSYQLLPAVLAFALLAGISLSSCFLAAAQDSMPLIVIGGLGGFMAPILASTGSGNHVALFSYYLLLNVALLGISVHKGWRPVSLLCFVFTFGVGSTWGVLNYSAERFWSTEPFLLGFGILFALTPVLMHQRARMVARDGTPSPDQLAQQGELVPRLSSSLTFGTPLTVLVLQGLLLEDSPLQMALALVGFGFAYLGGATLLLQSAHRSFLPFVESFLAVGIGFATLAIPYALSNHSLTAGAWALEGAGMVWVGIRQNRTRPRGFGIVLQLAAGVALVLGYGNHNWLDSSSQPAATQHLFGASLLAISCYLITFYSSHKRSLIPKSWAPTQLLLPWGLALGLAFGLGSLSEQLPTQYLPGAYFALVASVALGLELLSAALDYEIGRWPAALLYVITPLAVVGFLLVPSADPLSAGWLVAWPLLFTAMLVTAKRWLPKAPAGFDHAIVALALSASVLLGIVAFHLCQKAELTEAWGHSAFTSTQAFTLLTIVGLRGTRLWPFSQHRTMLVGPTALGSLLLCLCSLVIQTSLAGDPAPLPFFPVTNPLDLSHLLALTACAVYLLRSYSSVRGELAHIWPLATALVAFIVLNGMLARAVHHSTGVPYTFAQLWETPNMHWVLSGTWTVVAVSLIFLSSRRSWRHVWVAAASLMALTVLKLFLVDLSRQSTIAKIVTFLAVGVALLVVGFASPLPPKRPASAGPLPPERDPVLTPPNA